MRGKPYHDDSRPDWNSVRVNVMRWCLRVKLVQNWKKFSLLLQETGDLPIVEKKVRRTDFWGAKQTDDGTLVGRNVLGRLLMELRDDVNAGDRDTSTVVEPLQIPLFVLFDEPIHPVSATAQSATWRNQVPATPANDLPLYQYRF